MRPSLAEALDLQPHPEGGWYRQTWQATERVRTRDGRDRATATLILFLLPAGECSAWHRVASEEIWLAHLGVVALELGGDGPSPVPGTVQTVGVDLAAGQRLQVVVPAGVWQRTRSSATRTRWSAASSPPVSTSTDFELDRDV